MSTTSNLPSMSAAALLALAVGLSAASGATDATDACSAVLYAERQDCGNHSTEQPECEASGCCWDAVRGAGDVPWCFHKPKPRGRPWSVSGHCGAARDLMERHEASETLWAGLGEPLP